MFFIMVANLEIEPITIHLQYGGIETIRQNKNNMNTTHISPNEYSIDFTLKEFIIIS